MVGKKLNPILFKTLILTDTAGSSFQSYFSELSGNPGRPAFNSQVLSNSQTTYKISWITESFTPIEEYRLLYRKLPVSGNTMTLPLSAVTMTSGPGPFFAKENNGGENGRERKKVALRLEQWQPQQGRD